MRVLLSAVVAGVAAWGTAYATEGAGSNLVLGATTFGTPQFPAPGVYYTNYYNFYTTTRLNDDKGHSTVSGLRINLSADYNQVFYASPLEYRGFRFGAGLVVPFVAVGERVPGADKFVINAADILFQPLVVGWHAGNVYAAMVQGFYAPTGQYKPNGLISLSRNTWQYAPQLSVGYIDPAGFEATTTMSYVISDVNTRPLASLQNPTGAHYRSGQEFSADVAVGYNITPKFQLGVSAYGYIQTTGDKLSGRDANADFQAAYRGYKGSVIGIGPALRYLTNYGEFFLHAQQEVYARNHTQGTSLWARVNLAF